MFHFPYTNIFCFDFSFWELNANFFFYYFVLWYQLSLWQERPQIQGCATWSSGKEPPFHLGLGPSKTLPELFEVMGAHSGSTPTSWLLSLSVWTYVLVVLMFVNLFSWFEFTKEWLIQNCLWQKYTLLWLYSSGSDIVMGLLRGRNQFEF